MTKGKLSEEVRARECVADYYRENGKHDMAEEILGDNWLVYPSPREQSLIRAIAKALRSATPAREISEAEVARAKAWFDQNFNGLPDTDALVRGVLEAATDLPNHSFTTKEVPSITTDRTEGEIPGKREMYDGRLCDVVDASRSAIRAGGIEP